MSLGEGKEGEREKGREERMEGVSKDLHHLLVAYALQTLCWYTAASRARGGAGCFEQDACERGRQRNLAVGVCRRDKGQMS